MANLAAYGFEHNLSWNRRLNYSVSQNGERSSCGRGGNVDSEEQHRIAVRLRATAHFSCVARLSSRLARFAAFYLYRGELGTNQQEHFSSERYPPLAIRGNPAFPVSVNRSGRHRAAGGVSTRELHGETGSS